MKHKLKPCPFCGGEAQLTEDFIKCKKCYARVDWYDIKERKSKVNITAWNRRAGDE